MCPGRLSPSISPKYLALAGSTKTLPNWTSNCARPSIPTIGFSSLTCKAAEMSSTDILESPPAYPSQAKPYISGWKYKWIVALKNGRTIYFEAAVGTEQTAAHEMQGSYSEALTPPKLNLKRVSTFHCYPFRTCTYSCLVILLFVLPMGSSTSIKKYGDHE